MILRTHVHEVLNRTVASLSQIALRAIISCLKYLKVQINALEAAHDQGCIRNFSDLWTPPLPQVRDFNPVTPLMGHLRILKIRTCLQNP